MLSMRALSGHAGVIWPLPCFSAISGAKSSNSVGAGCCDTNLVAPHVPRGRGIVALPGARLPRGKRILDLLANALLLMMTGLGGVGATIHLVAGEDAEVGIEEQTVGSLKQLPAVRHAQSWRRLYTRHGLPHDISIFGNDRLFVMRPHEVDTRGTCQSKHRICK